jgi:hypothetical protein
LVKGGASETLKIPDDSIIDFTDMRKEESSIKEKKDSGDKTETTISGIQLAHDDRHVFSQVLEPTRDIDDS